MIRCFFYHQWSVWSPIRSYEATLEEWRVCSSCGKFEKGNTWRLAEREAVIKLHAETIPTTASIQLINGRSHERNLHS